MLQAAVASYFRKAHKFTRLAQVDIYRRAMRVGVAAAIEHAQVMRRLDAELVVDVGANVGQFSLLVHQERPNAHIIAFEPLAEAAATYRKVFAGIDTITLHQVAVGPDRAQAEMHVSERPDSSSLLPISSVQTELFPGTGEAGRENVTVAPLTDFITEAALASRALLKIDVQGFELDVLKSAGPLLPHFNWVYVEASFMPCYQGQALVHDVIAYLFGQNFYLCGLYDPSYAKNGEIAQADFLFERAQADPDDNS